MTRAQPRRMTRQYAALCLLEHGPLRFPEFVTITGWPETVASSVLEHLKARGQVVSHHTPGARRDVGKAVYHAVP